MCIRDSGNRVYVSELLNENYEFLHPDNTVVCQVRRARAALVLETEEGEDEEGEETSEEGESTEGGGEAEKKDDSSDGEAPAES